MNKSIIGIVDTDLDAQSILDDLSGGAAGAAVGCIAGALTGRAMPELEAKRYCGKVVSNNILIAVHVESNDAQFTRSSVIAGCH